MPEFDREAGYIFLHRRVMSSAIWRNVSDWRLAETILLRANWKPGQFQSRNGKVFEIGRGQLATSLESLSRESGLSIRSVRTALAHLKRSEFLTSRSTNHFRVISVVNYERYQNIDKHSDKDLTSTRQRYKKGKKDNNTDNGLVMPDLDSNAVPISSPQVPAAPSPFGPDELAALWNSKADKDFPRVIHITDKRRRMAQERLNTFPNPEHWEKAIAALNESSFAHGQGEQGWKANFDFLLRPDSSVKAIEGSYGNGWKGENKDAEHLYS